MSEPISNTPLLRLSDSELDLVGGGNAGLVEYELIVALIAKAAVAAITTIGTKVTANFTNTNNKL